MRLLVRVGFLFFDFADLAHDGKKRDVVFLINLTRQPATIEGQYCIEFWWVVDIGSRNNWLVRHLCYLIETGIWITRCYLACLIKRSA